MDKYYPLNVVPSNHHKFETQNSFGQQQFQTMPDQPHFYHTTASRTGHLTQSYNGGLQDMQQRTPMQSDGFYSTVMSQPYKMLQSRSQSREYQYQPPPVEAMVQQDLTMLLATERRRTSKLEKKLRKQDKSVQAYKDQRTRLTQELMHAQESNQNLLTQLDDQKQYFDHHITEMSTLLKDLEQHKHHTSQELDLQRQKNLHEQTQYSRKLKELTSENQSLHKQILMDQQRIDQHMKERETLVSDKDRQFQVELDKSKSTINKLIEDNIKDKNRIDVLLKESSEKEKLLRKLQRVIDDKDGAIQDIEDQMRDIQRQLKPQGDLLEVMQVCGASNPQQVVPFISEVLKRGKLNQQFLEKSQKLMLHFSGVRKQPQIKEVWRWVRKVVEDYYELSRRQQYMTQDSRNAKLQGFQSQEFAGGRIGKTPQSLEKHRTPENQYGLRKDRHKLSTIEKQVSIGFDSEDKNDQLRQQCRTEPQLNYDESQKSLESLKKENEYMDHIMDKVKDFFNIDKDAALIDIEIFLNKMKGGKN